MGKKKLGKGSGCQGHRQRRWWSHRLCQTTFGVQQRIGHPERACPTAVGSSSTTKYSCCQGVGHWTSACTSPGCGKFVPAHQRPKGGGKGASSLEEARGYPQQQQQQQQQQGNALAIAAPGQSMLSNWASQGPWMQAAGGPKVVDFVGAVGGWKLKVITSMAKAQRAYAPDYSSEATHVE